MIRDRIVVRDRIVGGVRGDELKRKLIAIKDLDENKATETCRAFEKATGGVIALNQRSSEASGGAEIDRVWSTSVPTRGRSRGGFQNRGFRSRSSSNYSNRRGGGRNNRNMSRDDGSNRGNNEEAQVCNHCAKRHPPGRTNCPALGRQCNACQGYNHFIGSAMCSRSGSGVSEVVEEEIEEQDVNMSALYIGAVQVDSDASEEEGPNTLFVGAVTSIQKKKNKISEHQKKTKRAAWKKKQKAKKKID